MAERPLCLKGPRLGGRGAGGTRSPREGTQAGHFSEEGGLCTPHGHPQLLRPVPGRQASESRRGHPGRALGERSEGPPAFRLTAPGPGPAPAPREALQDPEQGWAARVRPNAPWELLGLRPETGRRPAPPPSSAPACRALPEGPGPALRLVLSFTPSARFTPVAQLYARCLAVCLVRGLPLVAGLTPGAQFPSGAWFEAAA